MAASNLGRVQGGGFFGSTSASTTSIEKTTVQTNGVSPLVGDTVVNANGDLCRITAITEGAYTVTKYGSVKGTKGDKGADYEKPEGGIPRTDLSEEVQALLGNDATARAAAEAAANAAEKAQSTANGKQDKLTFDSTPTADSKNPVTSGGVKSALDGKYTKPADGIPKTDLAEAVQTSLGKTDNAVLLAGDQTVAGEKTFTNRLSANSGKVIIPKDDNAGVTLGGEGQTPYIDFYMTHNMESGNEQDFRIIARDGALYLNESPIATKADLRPLSIDKSPWELPTTGLYAVTVHIKDEQYRTFIMDITSLNDAIMTPVNFETYIDSENSYGVQCILGVLELYNVTGTNPVDRITHVVRIVEY